MTDEHELYAAVLADPDDPAPRRALGELYDRKGDPHGEFIRVQLAYAEIRARGEHDNALFERERALIQAHGRAWAAPLADLVTSYKFHRGFIGQVELALDRFLEVAPTLFAIAPIQHLDLTKPASRLAELLRSPYLARLSSLGLDELRLGDDGAKQVAAAPALRTLHYLSLCGNKIGQPGVEALAASPYLARLAVVDLLGNPCDPVPRPAAHDLDGKVTAIDRPMLTNVLVSRFGERPWLANPENPETWPLPRDSYR